MSGWDEGHQVVLTLAQSCSSAESRGVDGASQGAVAPQHLVQLASSVVQGTAYEHPLADCPWDVDACHLCKIAVGLATEH